VTGQVTTYDWDLEPTHPHNVAAASFLEWTWDEAHGMWRDKLGLLVDPTHEDDEEEVAINPTHALR